MTAKEAKSAIISHCVLWSSHVLACTESIAGNSCDVMSVTPSLRVIEYEVKVSKADLRKEFVKDSKRHKHMTYLGEFQSTYSIIPNYFYVAVPKELVEEATNLLEGKPYGVVQIQPYEVKKKAKALHTNPLRIDQLLRLTKRMAVENVTLRRKS